ncbi:MAG: GGDEF domain-containing protein [Xanthomonadaceae bacterium]|nr:GGDEF domain-containing protein [Xanthomonadaceae bacterium]MDE2248498.1 GGDEF domain-containing protein [Xanthomonadaceae bacterium]
MHRLDDAATELSPRQQLYRRYLMARQVAFRGDFTAAIPLLAAIADQSADRILSFRASATMVDLLVTQSRYEEAYERLGPLLSQLPQVAEKRARIQALGVAAQLYFEAGQYDLAENYAEQLLKESDSPKSTCIGWYYKLDALVGSGGMKASGAEIRDGTDACNKAGDVLISDMFKAIVARVDIQKGQPAEAIKLLTKNYLHVQQKRFPPAVANFDELLAVAYWQTNDFDRAKNFALRVVASNQRGGSIYSESMATAYRILYQVEKRSGNLGAALAYHEKYMAADKGYLNDVSAKVLAYQIVKQRVLAKRLQIESLDKRNKILTLQGQLDRKAAETSRLWVVLLLSLLAFIAFVTYRIWRSQLRFMRLARRDGLTGIFNRQHFLAEAERLLQYCRKSSREACLVLIDLDHFKVVNDTFGHSIGDRVLKRAVEACQKHLRSTDVFGRLGGEEFGILLPECSLEQVSVRAEVLRLAVASVAMDDVLDVQVSGSFGIAATAGSGYELRDLLIDADDALYQAKHDGRNRTVVFDASKADTRSRQRKSRSGQATGEALDHA